MGLKCEGNLLFLGIEARQGKKDPTKSFDIASFLCDKKSFEQFVFEPETVKALSVIPAMTLVHCVFGVRIGDRGPSLFLQSVTPVNSAAPVKQK